MKIISFLTHRNTFLLLALVCGLLLGSSANVLQPVAPYILSLVLGLSAMDFEISRLREARTIVRIALNSFILNFLFLGGVMVLMYKIIFGMDELMFGFLLLAISPPGPSVVPFTLILGGNTALALIGFVLLHLVTMFLLPLLLVFYDYHHHFSPSIFFVKVVLLTIVVPFLLSRLFRFKMIRQKLLSWRGKLVNAGFFFIIVPIVGQSVAVIRAYPEYIWQSTVIFLIVMGIMPLILNVIMKLIGINQADRIAYTFLSTTKSSAFAAVITFSLGAASSSLPVAIHAFFVTFFFIIYSLLRRWIPDN